MTFDLQQLCFLDNGKHVLTQFPRFSLTSIGLGKKKPELFGKKTNFKEWAQRGKSNWYDSYRKTDKVTSVVEGKGNCCLKKDDAKGSCKNNIDIDMFISP